MSQQTVLITGASSGIGYEMAKIFAENNYNLVIVARTKSVLEQLAMEIKKKYDVDVAVIQKDLSINTSSEQLFKEVSEKGIKIDALVNNAGFGEWGAFISTSLEKEKSMIDLNIKTLTELTKYFLPAMIKQKWGRIINVSSTAAFQPGPYMAVYYATKAYVESFSEALSEELRGTGVTVTSLCPGPTESGFSKAANMGSINVFNGKLPSSHDVALYGYRAAMKGQRIAVHGTKYQMLIFFERFIPRFLITWIIGKMQKSRK